MAAARQRQTPGGYDDRCRADTEGAPLDPTRPTTRAEDTPCALGSLEDVDAVLRAQPHLGAEFFHRLEPLLTRQVDLEGAEDVLGRQHGEEDDRLVFAQVAPRLRFGQVARPVGRIGEKPRHIGRHLSALVLVARHDVRHDIRLNTAECAGESVQLVAPKSPPHEVGVSQRHERHRFSRIERDVDTPLDSLELGRQGSEQGVPDRGAHGV
jgi:hypothetical protein